MKHLEDRLVRELGEIAEQATTSPDALPVIQSRASSYRPDDEEEVVVMLAPADRPHRRRRPRMALALGAVAAVVLVAFGVVVLRSGSDDVATVDSTPRTETPATADPTIPTETAAAVDTTIPSAPAGPWAGPPLDGEWIEVATGEPWGPALVGEIDALPGGGYVTVTPETAFTEIAERDGFSIPTVMWSPDGVEWFDGDPEREIGRSESLPLAVAGDRVAVVDGTDLSDHVRLVIGDPRIASWDVVALDYAALDGDVARVEDVSLAANDDEVLVLGGLADDGRTTGVVTWVVDPTTGTWEANSVEVADGPTQVAWVDGLWILFANERFWEPVGDQVGRRTALWTSSDGLVWSQADLPMPGEDVPSLAVGPMGVVAASCTGMGAHNEIWYSADGLDWDLISQVDGGCYEATAVGDYGFVITGEDAVTGEDPEPLQLLAPDGSGMYRMPAPFEDLVAAASSGDTLLVSTGEISSGFWRYSPS